MSSVQWVLKKIVKLHNSGDRRAIGTGQRRCLVAWNLMKNMANLLKNNKNNKHHVPIK